MKAIWAVLTVLLVFTVSCKSTDKNSLGPQGSFEVQSIKKDSVADKEMTINFNAENGQINGKGVCNSYSSTYVVSGTNIKFSPAMSTKMMCPEGTTLEYNFFQALLNASSYKLKRGKLTLFDADEAVLLTASEN
ncbi:META domain-containing protein [Leeuwenhoekiella nanhaiensis]|uniref:DUF306 domain-containing protein n=1 Tax=Leeuwenhoekiella nanhaiensis TaxID=1655491 RepID=A0A2G1VW64_9FLAO|nr:META domain-containing protein [Leeuwenhoekiella nanhaiensis]PHQ31028.1 hypothetical protein CJ305_02040 [Leeuwenhoekiella nanhaiensis]